MVLRNTVKIGDHLIGDGHPCFVVAEVGGNHNLNFEQALRMIDIASDAGAAAVKFALSRAETQYPPDAGSARYLGADIPIYEIVRRREIPYEWVTELMDYSKKKTLIFLCSSFDIETTDVLSDNNIVAFKIASYEATHHPLLRHIARKGKPIIMSVGVTTMEEIEESVDVILGEGNDQIILMHCIGAYPAPIESTNLKVIPLLKERFGCPVGLSDHSRNPIIVPACATVLGANIIEKHFTISNLLPGADHVFAVESEELKNMVDAVCMAQSAVGTGEKQISPAEEELYNFARRTIFTTKVVRKGEVFTEANTAVLRSGKHPIGLLPKDYDIVLGVKSGRDFIPYEVIKGEDIVA